MTEEPTSAAGILYIDDEEKALKYFRMAFAAKYPVFTATTGAEGLEILRREADRIGIVVSDQRMPEMSGADVLGRVREEFPHKVRILTTAYSDLTSAIEAVNKGHIYQYVVKPWEIVELEMVLRRAADYHHVMSERNLLLSLKMTTLQRILCGDRLRGFLLAAEAWEAPRREAFHRVLAALVAALPDRPVTATAPARGQDLDAGAVMRREYAAMRMVVGSLRDRAQRHDPALPELVTALRDRLGVDHVAESASPGDAHPVIRITASAAGAEVFSTLFGVLLDKDIPSASVCLLETLLDLAEKNGSLTVRCEPDGPEFVFRLPGVSPDLADQTLDVLYDKFSRWDIFSR